MSARRFNQLLTIAGPVVVFAVLGLAWVAWPALLPAGWLGRLVVVGSGIILGAAATLLAQCQLSNAAQAARKHIDALCALEPAALGDSEATSTGDSSHEDQAWGDLCNQVRERLASFAHRTDELEVARTAADIRARRVVTERDQFREILSGLIDPIVAVDQFGDIVLANPSAERLLDVKAGDREHSALEQLSRCEQLVQLLGETRRRRAITHKSTELTLLDEDGKQHWFRVTCRALATGDEPATIADRTPAHGAVAVLTDITGQKAIQKRNAEFVSSVSHEMKTPLSSIRAYVELLVDGEADDETTREEFLEVINSQADRLQRLIDNLLNLARIEAGVVAVNKTALSLNELLSEAIEVMQPAAADKQITLISEPSPLYLGVLADRDMLLQAAINLLSNAVKYTKSGGSVTLKSRLNDQEVVFEVQDTGVGLSADDCLKVFEKFYRVKKDREMAQGTGLGLSLVKHIVEDVHGGHIEVASELGRGSTFRVVLPAMVQLNA